MPGLEQDARQIINTIAYQIRDQYGPESVLKEMIQNADDAGAEHLVIIGLPGLVGATNPLLQAPGILVANDGPVSRSQLRAMTRASGSDKANDVAKAGRFGLGQKSLFNLCDAFIVQGWLGDADGTVEHRIINPFVELEAAEGEAAVQSWEAFLDADKAALEDAFNAAGFTNLGTAIYIPLRSSHLRPAPGAGFSTTEPNLEATVANYANADALGIVAAALRNLRSIRIGLGYNPPFLISVRPDGERLAGPTAGGAFRRAVRGEVATSSNSIPITFCAEEHQLPPAMTAGFTADSRWPSTIDEHHRRIPEKAAPHAASVLARTVDTARSAIHIHWAVFLPIDAGSDVRIDLNDPSIGRIDLLLHGYFFVDSGRRSISFQAKEGDQDQAFRVEWNAMVRREATLPLVLPTILRAFGEVGLAANQKRTIVRAIAASAWWTEVSAEAAGELALAECLVNGGEPAWQQVGRHVLRPLPRIDLLPIPGLLRLFPTFRDWALTRDIVGAFDPSSTLSAGLVEWDNGELAALLDTLDPRSLQRTEATEQLAVFLSTALRASRHDEANARLVTVLRRAMAGDAPLASPQAIARITEFMPSNDLFPLPRSVENRAILRALATSGGALLAVRAAFAPNSPSRSIDTTTAIDWLAALEDLVGLPGDVGDQANAAVAAIIAAGPSLADLNENERARNLRVVRARRVGRDDYELLTLSELTQLSASGRLFSSQPGEMLRKLGAAVPDVPLFIIRLSEDSGAAGKLRLQAPSSAPAAAAIVREATAFGDAYERGQLLNEMLRDDSVDRQILRALCIGEPLARVTGTELLSLAAMPQGFALMTMEASTVQPMRRVVPQIISDHFSNAVRSRLGVREIDLEHAARLIGDAHRAGALRARSPAEAEDILGSGIEWSILARLPVFSSTRGMVALDEPLFREDGLLVPISMREMVAVYRPSGEATLRWVNTRVPAWTAATQVEAGLSQSDPSDFAGEMLEAFEFLSDQEVATLRSRLRSVAWIPGTDGAPLRGDDVLTLHPAVDAEVRAALPDAPFTPFDQLPAMIREHRAAPLLRQSVFATAEESLEALALQLEAEPGLMGSLVDPVSHFDDIARLAAGSADLQLPGWPLLAAVLRTSGGLASASSVLASLTGVPSSSEQLVLHLNAISQEVGSGQKGEAARRVHRSAFLRYSALLLGESGWLPQNLLLPSKSSVFREAEALAARGHGLAVAYELDRHYRDSIAFDDERSGLDRVGSQPPSPQIACLEAEAVRTRFAGALRDLFEPWRRAVPSDAIVLVLGLLGRDDAMRALAREWQSDTRSASYEAIWATLDAELAPLLGRDDLDAVLSCTLFTAGVVTESVEVQSAAGTPCTVPLATDHGSFLVGNPVGSRRRVFGVTGESWHHVDLAFVPRSPTSLQLDRPLYQTLVELICPAVMLALPGQKAVVLACFARMFEIDQVTIDDTIAKLRDQSPTLVRTLVVPEAGIVRSALSAFERVSPTDAAAIQSAKATLWSELHADGAADELLSSVRSKIAQMGYAPSRVFFELLQNADDAYVQVGVTEGRVRIEVEATADGAPLLIRFVHWGRPINHPGPLTGTSTAQGYQNDLYNMLAINHSEKPIETGTTGKFGLGFKTIHMITRNARVASGFVGASIVGGMIPQEWAAGIEAVRARAHEIDTATLIEIPVDPDCAIEASSALDAFLACAEWLPVIASRIRRIEVMDTGSDRPFASNIDPLAGGLEVVRNSGHRARRALRLDLNGGFSMLIGMGRSGPEAIVASSSIWNLVPLEEQAASRWLINGPFDVDPGRSHIKGTPEQQATTFSHLGAALGNRLVELFDLIGADPVRFASTFDMDGAGLGTFWTKLALFFEPDLAREREVRLHYGDRGLGRLWRQRPAISTGLAAPYDQPLQAQQVRLRTAYALAVPAVFAAVAEWPSMRLVRGTIVAESVGIRLMDLAVATPSGFTLRELVAREIGGERQVSVQVALRLGAVLTRAGLETDDLQSERSWLLAELRNTQFMSKAGTWVDVGRLAFETGEEDVENLRAAFAPDLNILSHEYRGAALEFFRAARSSSGFGPNAFVMRGWAEQAIEPVKRTAFLRYLLRDNPLAMEVAARPISWLPIPLSELRGHFLLVTWTASDVTLLLALFQQIPPYVPPPVEDEPPEPYDPTEFLDAIHGWWILNGRAEADRYDELTYPPGFNFAQLRENDPTAWFTMFALAIFQNIGRTQDMQGRSFVETGLREGWWSDLAVFAQTADIDRWIERLDAWSDPEAGDQRYLSWRRCLVDLYAVAKYLPEYITLVRALPGAIHEEGVVALESLMRPYQSSIAARLDVTAPSIDRSIGMGMNWLVRELLRHDVFDEVEAVALHPYGWTASARARRLLAHAEIDLPEPGRMDESRLEYAEILDALDPPRAIFEGDLDLPLQLLARQDFLGKLVAALVAHGLDPSGVLMEGENG